MLSRVASGNRLWLSKGKPTEQDLVATQNLLDLRKKFVPEFEDRKTIKMQLWIKIANELCDLGYEVGRGKEGGIKCRQKFANLTRTYLAYIKNKKTTGAERLDEPPFYNDMHEILGYKDKVNPQNMQDSLETVSNVLDDEPDLPENEVDSISDTSTAGSSSHIRNRFCKASRSLKPKSCSSLILEEVKKQHKEILEQREKHFKLFQDHLNQKERQNERFINIIENMLRSRNKKPNREEESDLSE